MENNQTEENKKFYSVNSKEDFIALIQSELLTSVEVIEMLQVSRQTLHSLVKRGKLIPVKELSRDRLFLREDIEQRKAESEELNAKYRPYDK